LNASSYEELPVVITTLRAGTSTLSVVALSGMPGEPLGSYSSVVGLPVPGDAAGAAGPSFPLVEGAAGAVGVADGAALPVCCAGEAAGDGTEVWGAGGADGI
jgi:hypothetical protein